MIPLLDTYPNKKSAEVLRAGFTDGFKLIFHGDRLFRNSPNLKSVKLDPDSTLSKVMKEVKLNRIAGPFQKVPISNLMISPIGLVSKSEPGKLRLIQHFILS